MRVLQCNNTQEEAALLNRSTYIFKCITCYGVYRRRTSAMIKVLIFKYEKKIRHMKQRITILR